MAISNTVVNKALRSTLWLSAPAPIRLMIETSTINRIGQYQSPENIRRVSRNAGCLRRWASGRMRITWATGRRMRITSKPKDIDAANPVNTAMLLVRLLPS
ncbi:hypothetical protein D3C87_1083120 [compost metagenome]